MRLGHALFGSRADAATAAPRGETCFACIHFRNDAATLTAALPGLSVFSSFHASVRADDGLCLRHDRFINGGRRCAQFAPRSSRAPAA
jgi:hypothetical protein